MNKNKKQELKLSDEVIAQITRLIQLGILTGTDITDQMRLLRVVVGENNYLEPSEEFLNYLDNLEVKLSELARLELNKDV